MSPSPRSLRMGQKNFTRPLVEGQELSIAGKEIRVHRPPFNSSSPASPLTRLNDAQ